jgi:hypothetical protein
LSCRRIAQWIEFGVAAIPDVPDDRQAQLNRG